MQNTKDTICFYLFFHQNLLFSFKIVFLNQISNPSRFSLGLTSKVLFFLEDINHTDFLRLFSLNSISLHSDNVAEYQMNNSKNKFLKTNNLENICTFNNNNLEGTFMFLKTKYMIQCLQF